MGVLGWAVWSLKCRAATGKDRMNTAEVRALETLDKMSDLLTLVEGLNWTVSGGSVRVAEVADTELIHAWSVITATLSDNESTVREAICDVCGSFPVEASSDASVPSVGARLIKPRSC